MKILKKSVLNLYFSLIICIYPLYIHNGYYDLCEVKRNFLYWVSSSTFFIFVIILIINLFFKKQILLDYKDFFKNITLTQKFLLIYCFIIIISYLFSDFKSEVLWGTDGWYMGTILLLLMCVLSLITSYLYSEKELVLYYFILASSFVFALAICNRFSYYPIMEPYLPTFISTLGNINWFNGYMSIVAPIGISLYVLSETENFYGKILLLLYCLLTFITGFCQGSFSIFLWEGCMFFILLWISLKKMKWIQNWLITLLLWGLSGQFVRILKYLFPYSFNYKYAKLIDTNLTLVVSIAALFIFIILKYNEKIIAELTNKTIKNFRILLLSCLSFGFLIYSFLSIINTKIGIPFLHKNSIFTWNLQWGTDRGVCFSTALLIFERMPIFKKMIGVGADGFCAFAYSDSLIAEYINSFFSDALLTNGHNEFLTSLVNLGILGTLSYIGIFVTFFIECMKKGEKNTIIYVFAVCVICYFTNNMVNFAQIYSTPYLFLLLGVGNTYLYPKSKSTH